MILKKGKNIIFWSAIAACLAAALLVSMILGSLPKKAEDRSLPEVTETIGGGNYFRFLVAGSDATSGLCDVLMLVSIDRASHEVFVLQIPRDTYAKYTEKSYRKLNGAYASLGGMDGFREFLSKALGVSIDRTLHLSPSAFRSAVDALGGVEIDLPRDLDYDDPAQKLSIHLKAGKQTLDGAGAEQFVRYRAGYVQGDLDRIDAQKLFLSALFRKVSELGVFEAATLAIRMRNEVDTDLEASDIFSLAGELISLSPDRVFFVTAPVAAVTAEKSGASYYVLSAPAMEELLVRHFGASEGGFDSECVFLNENNERFRKIYGEYCAYSVQECS